MIALPTHGRVYLACGSTDMRRGFDGLAVMVQEVLMQDLRIRAHCSRSRASAAGGATGDAA